MSKLSLLCIVASVIFAVSCDKGGEEVSKQKGIVGEWGLSEKSGYYFDSEEWHETYFPYEEGYYFSEDGKYFSISEGYYTTINPNIDDFSTYEGTYQYSGGVLTLNGKSKHIINVKFINDDVIHFAENHTPLDGYNENSPVISTVAYEGETWNCIYTLAPFYALCYTKKDGKIVWGVGTLESFTTRSESTYKRGNKQ